MSKALSSGASSENDSLEYQKIYVNAAEIIKKNVTFLFKIFKFISIFELDLSSNKKADFEKIVLG